MSCPGCDAGGMRSGCGRCGQHLLIASGFAFFRSMESSPETTPNGTGRIFSTNPDLADILGRKRILILRICILGIFLDPNFLDFQVPRFPEIWPGPDLTEVLWPTGLRSHHDQKMLIFYTKYWCLSSRPLVSCRRYESKCHQVLFFPDQNERRVPRGPLIAP